MIRLRALLLALFFGAVATRLDAQAQRAITNDDVVTMVKSQLAESTIVAAIQASPINFDISPQALIVLKDAGVTARVMDAMLAESKKRAGKAASSARPGTSATGAGRLSFGVAPTGGLTAAALVNGERIQIEGQRARIAQTRTKPTSMSALSKDKLLGQVFQSGVRTGTNAGRVAAGGGLAGGAVSSAGGILGEIVGNSTGKTNDRVTYVWALAGTTASVLPARSATIEISMERVLNVTPDDYAPVIIQLAVTEQQTRLVGAAEWEAVSPMATAPTWELYGQFVEEIVVAESRKTAPGKWELTASLPPGSYAVVLRPVSKSKKFAGRDVVYSLRDGLVFNSTWPFDVQ